MNALVRLLWQKYAASSQSPYRHLKITLDGCETDVTGDEGGYIDLRPLHDPTANTGSFSVDGGAGGTTDGVDSWICIDGNDVGPSYQHRAYRVFSGQFPPLMVRGL